MEKSAGSLAQKHCVPCEGSGTPLSRDAAQSALKNLQGWELKADGKSIRAEYAMKNFSAAVKLIQSIAQIAEEENHHPDLHLTSYRRLAVELSTHAIGGLSENDFILAAKIQELPKELKSPA